MLYPRSYQTLFRKTISMLTGLKLSFSACKCVFYRPEYNAKERPNETVNFEGPETQKWNIPTDRAQNSDKKWSHLSSYHGYSCIYGDKNVTNGSLFIFWGLYFIFQFQDLSTIGNFFTSKKWNYSGNFWKICGVVY